jgi:hypothetical protein
MAQLAEKNSAARIRLVDCVVHLIGLNIYIRTAKSHGLGN